MPVRGIAYGVGVGPGDPELMTLKAARLIRECDVIAVPGGSPEESVAYRIAAGAVPEIAEKELLPVPVPMTRDPERLEAAHREAADRIERRLDLGRSLAYLTLGDPTVYCSFGYVQRILEADGYRVELVSGVTSFCAAAARLGIPLVERDQPLRVLPSAADPARALEPPGTCVLMKPARRLRALREALQQSGRRVFMVENCGAADERVFRSAEEIPDDAGYLSLIIAKEPGRNR